MLDCFIKTPYGEWYRVSGIKKNGGITWLGPERGDDGWTQDYLVIPKSMKTIDGKKIISIDRTGITVEGGKYLSKARLEFALRGE